MSGVAVREILWTAAQRRPVRRRELGAESSSRGPLHRARKARWELIGNVPMAAGQVSNEPGETTQPLLWDEVTSHLKGLIQAKADVPVNNEVKRFWSLSVRFLRTYYCQKNLRMSGLSFKSYLCLTRKIYQLKASVRARDAKVFSPIEIPHSLEP